MITLVYICCLWFLFFFFKQKTAYEMRISDWSSDVCSSDLDRLMHHQASGRLQALSADFTPEERIGRATAMSHARIVAIVTGGIVMLVPFLRPAVGKEDRTSVV